VQAVHVDGPAIEAMIENVLGEPRALGEAEEGEDDRLDVRRARGGDLRIAPDDDGVAVVAGVVPAPDDRFAGILLD